MRKTFLINSIMSVVIAVLVFAFFLKNPDGYNISQHIAAEYCGGSILLYIFSLFDFFAAKKPSKKDELRIRKFAVLMMALVSSVCVSIFLYESLQAQLSKDYLTLIIEGVLILGGIIALICEVKINRHMSECPEDK